MIAKVIKAFYDKVIPTDYVRNTNDVDIMRDDINDDVDIMRDDINDDVDIMRYDINDDIDTMRYDINDDVDINDDIDTMRYDINAIIDKLKVIDVPEKIHTIMDRPLKTVEELQDEFVFFSFLLILFFIFIIER
jgi:hypothetical protein